MAAGMGWGIRGQYGHESGAMIAGTLASLTLVLLFIPQVDSLRAARAAAMMTVAVGIGGTMTYGQTIGLTQNQEVIGNWEAARWGFLGLAIKGGIWIGFAGAFLGMGLGGKRYRPIELAILTTVLLGLVFLGIRLINAPYNPAEKLVPPIYFSESLDFYPNKDVAPRREVWGGLLVALLALILYARVIRQDVLAGRMALFGILGGALGFPGGQTLQSFHAWNRELFTSGALAPYHEYLRHVGWWNMMEITFGLTWGAVMALGLWLNYDRIAIEDSPDDVTLSPTFEVVLCSVHLVLLLTAEFLRLPGHAGYITIYINFGLLMCILPMTGIAGGRFWPYLLLLPVVGAPIVGKSVRRLSFRTDTLELSEAWFYIVQIPMAVLLCVAVWLICRGIARQSARHFASIALLVTTWTYYLLNTRFFDFAWPWNAWTGRTPSQIIFMTCTACLTVAAIVLGCRSSKQETS